VSRPDSSQGSGYLYTVVPISVAYCDVTPRDSDPYVARLEYYDFTYLCISHFIREWL